MRYNSLQLPFWLFTLTFVFGLTLPILIQDAMFQDAVLYSAVSHNLSQGVGNFWFPIYSKLNIAGLSSFHEQPPLVFGIQALFFKLIGSSIYTERIYTLLMLILTMFLINLIWTEVFRPNIKLKQLGWIPIFFWIGTPSCFWSFRNNMHENTMGIFILLSVWLSVRALNRQHRQIILLVLSGTAIFLATLSKGFPGFFPLVTPIAYWLIVQKHSFKQTLTYSSILFVVPLILYGLLFLYPESNKSLSIYLFQRAFVRIDSMPTVNSHFKIIGNVISELLPVLIILTITFLISKYKKERFVEKNDLKIALFFVALGLAGTLPLSLTLVQRNFYIVPAMPFFAIGVAILVAKFYCKRIEHINIHNKAFRIVRLFSITILLGILIFAYMQKGNISRQKDMLKDVYKIGTIVPKYSTITVPNQIYDEYNFYLQGFLVRLFGISIDPYNKYEFYLTEKNLTIDISAEYEKIDLNTIKYDLYRKKNYNNENNY